MSSNKKIFFLKEETENMILCSQKKSHNNSLETPRYSLMENFSLRLKLKGKSHREMRTSGNFLFETSRTNNKMLSLNASPDIGE